MNWASVFEWHKRFKEGRESLRDDARCGRSKEVPIVQTLLPVTFGHSLSSEAVVMWQLRWKRLRGRSLTRSHKRTSMGPFDKLLERYNRCIAAGGDYLEGGESIMCVLSMKVPIQKKSGNLSYAPRIYIYIYIYIYTSVCVYVCVYKKIIFSIIIKSY